MNKLLTALIAGVLAFLGALALGLIIALISGFVVWLLWSPVVVEVFHGPVITYWQAVYIALLAGTLFGRSK